METILQAPDRDLDYKRLSKEIPQWIAETSLDKNLTIWVSGWVDSAVVSTLSAMSWKALTTLEMPIHQNSDESQRARKHVEWLQKNFSLVSSQIIDLTGPYEALRELQWAGDTSESEYLADVNMRSRLRAVQLYATANRKHSMVMGTWNLVEDYGIWFFTKFGDGAVDLSPIGELRKSEVYRLWQELWISQEILRAKPTDGLHPTWATDEDQIGCTYDELEWAMVAYDEWKRIRDFDGRAQEVMKIYTARHEGNAHKMKMPPVFELKI